MSLIEISVIGASIIGGIVVFIPAVKFSMDMAPYLYTNTRCSAKTALILEKKDYEQLSNASFEKEVYAILENTSYSHLVEESKDFNSFSSKLDHNLFETYNWLSNIVPTKLTKVVDSFKLKFEINNIKLLLSNIKQNRSTDLKYVADENLKLKLETAKDISSFQAAIEGSKYQEVLEGKDLTNLQQVSNSLDIYYYQNINTNILMCKDQKGAEPFKVYLQKLIDISNLRLSLRKINGSNVEFIKGGSIRAEDLSPINDKTQLTNLLSESNYNITTIDNLELELLKKLRTDSNNFQAKYPLKSGTVIKFIVQKELEIKNLNLITKLKAENFKSDEIQRLLV